MEHKWFLFRKLLRKFHLKLLAGPADLRISDTGQYLGE
jgi:hypothetical protein